MAFDFFLEAATVLQGYRSLKRSSRKSRFASSFRRKPLYRRSLMIEPLESRHLLSVSLAPIPDQTLLSGAGLCLALDGWSEGGNPLTYTVEVSDAVLSNPSIADPQLSAVIPTGNPSLRLLISSPENGIDGEMVFQLFQDLTPETVSQITALANSGFYDGLTFHRVIDGFMIQGGDPNGDGTGGPGFKFDDEFHAELQFTTAGLLAMANSGDDTNGSQFFITDTATRWLDFQHTIFGFLTAGDDVRRQISTVATDAGNKPLHDVVITSATIFYDTENGVLRLFAPEGTTGTAVITVTVTDSVTGETAGQSFLLTLEADTSNSAPFLGKIDPIVTDADTPITFNIPATDVEGDAMYFAGQVTPYNANLTLTVNSATGEATLTPRNGVYGVFSIILGVSTATPNTYDTQYVPVYINPPAPGSISLAPTSDTGSSSADGITSLNNSGGVGLEFTIDGVIPGAVVQVFAGDVLLGEAVAAGSTITITTDGATMLADGVYQITARQTLTDQTVDVGNLHTTTDLQSAFSSAFSLTIDTTPPEFTSTPITTAYEAGVYNYQPSVSDETTVLFSLTEAPTDMTISSLTGLITWWPVSAVSGETVNVTVKATDAAGNSTEQSFSIDILPPNTEPVLTPAAPLMAVTDEDTPTTVPLASFINHGAGTTTITDADEDAVVGGIVVIGLTGNGTWEYSLDGVNFTAIGDVSETSALLLSSSASLRYLPDGCNGETATITYRAWDATAGAAGTKMDASTVGEHGPFSAETDTATLTVTDVNDAPILTPAAPSLGGTDSITSITIPLTGSFINNGYGTTIITEVDEYYVTLGGIALVGASGNGVWQYSLDGTTFTPIGAVSESSALLLPATAKLRYVPDGVNSETATITYRAWDTTSGVGGTRVDLSGSGAAGGATAFSLASDTATLNVTAAAVSSISGYVYIDADNDGLRFTADGRPQAAIAGVTIKLLRRNSSGNWVVIATTTTAADGSYLFTNLPAGTYKIQEVQPAAYLDGKDTLGKVAGQERGTVGQDEFQLQLGGGEEAVEYNFGELGLKPGAISLRLLLASSESSTQYTPSQGSSPSAQPVIVTPPSNGTQPGEERPPDEETPPEDETPPGGYSITAVDQYINAEKAASTGFTFADAEVGATYIYIITSSGGGESLFGGGTITSATQQITGIDVSSLPDGTLTFSVTLTDAAGNIGPTVSATAELDRQAPSGYSIELAFTAINSENAANTFIRVLNAEPFTTYTYTVVSSGGEGTVNGSGTGYLTEYWISDIDVSALPDGELTYSLTLMDAAGNVGPVVTASAILDRSAVDAAMEEEDDWLEE